MSSDIQINKCTVCRRAKHQLRSRQSKLNKKATLLLCQECFDTKKEPRGFVILFARANGVSSVKEYIIGHRYYGDKITAEEIVV
jgi:hypothetical protein